MTVLAAVRAGHSSGTPSSLIFPSTRSALSEPARGGEDDSPGVPTPERPPSAIAAAPMLSLASPGEALESLPVVDGDLGSVTPPPPHAASDRVSAPKQKERSVRECIATEAKSAGRIL